MKHSRGVKKVSYRVESKDGHYQIVEKDNELVVMQLDTYKEARALCRSLNLGSGFDGFTPLFFTQSFKQTKKAPT